MSRLAALNQSAVVWPATGYDGRGNPTYGDPYQICARWERTKITQVGEDLLKVVKYLSVIVECCVKQNSRIWEGKLANLPEGLDPGTQALVINCDEIPSINGRETIYTVTATAALSQ